MDDICLATSTCLSMRRLAFLAAASLGLGVAVIVDQPAAFARCDQGPCPCRYTGIVDSVRDDKCRCDCR